MRFRIPEILLGVLLAIAIFAMGMSIEWTRNKATEANSSQKRAQENNQIEKGTFGGWVTHDAAGFFTFALAAIGIAQAGLFVWQLTYMRKGIDNAKIAGEAAKDAAVAGTKQAIIAEQQLIANQRPWVKVDSITPISDLVFENGEARLDLLVIVSNKGNSPGLRVRVDAKIVASNQISLLDEQRGFAANFRADALPNEVRPEITSWPGDVIQFPIKVRLNSIDMRRFKPLADNTPFPITLLALVGCIDYEFSFAPGHHQTGLIYTIRKKTPYPGALINDQIAGARGAVRLEGTIRRSDLEIAIGFEGTGPVD